MNAREFYSNKFQFSRMMEKDNPRLVLGPDIPILNEDKAQGFDEQYIYHTAWAARCLVMYGLWDRRGTRHVDIGSSLYFAGIVSAFLPVDYYDFRPPRLELDGLTVHHADIMALPFASASLQSVSCLHVIEHIGLGRYGDPIDPDGDIKAMHELARVLAVGGRLLLAVPLGPMMVHYNAHRLYTAEYIKETFTGLGLDLEGEEVYAGCGCFVFGRIR